MSNQTKKKEELKSLTEFLRLCTDPLAKRLKVCRNISVPNQERPDIVLVDEDTVYGIECIHIPICREGNGDADQVQRARERAAVEKYHVDPDNGIDKLDGHEDEAKRDIEHLLNKKLESFRTFDYKNFILMCTDLLRKHDAKTYLTNIENVFPERNHCICFLLDVTKPNIFDEFEYFHRVNNRQERGVRKDYPFTVDFLKALENVPGVCRFLLIWHPDREYPSGDTRCYVLNPLQDWNGQVRTIWQSFKLPEESTRPWRAKLNIAKEYIE